MCTDCYDTRVSSVIQPLVFTSARAGDTCEGHDKWQHSQECKHPPFLGTSIQSELTAQENNILEGNKNETGFSKGSNISTKKECHQKMCCFKACSPIFEQGKMKKQFQR